VFVACDLVEVHKQASQLELWKIIGRDPYMRFALQEAFDTLRIVLEHLLENDYLGRRWYVCASWKLTTLIVFSLSFKRECKVRLNLSLLD